MSMTKCWSVKADRPMTLSLGSAAIKARVASIPFMPGMPMSMQTMSGLAVRTRRSNSLPSPASLGAMQASATVEPAPPNLATPYYLIGRPIVRRRQRRASSGGNRGAAPPSRASRVAQQVRRRIDVGEDVIVIKVDDADLRGMLHQQLAGAAVAAQGADRGEMAARPEDGVAAAAAANGHDNGRIGRVEGRHQAVDVDGADPRHVGKQDQRAIDVGGQRRKTAAQRCR